RGLKAIPGGVWALGLVSLFMDTSSELIHGLLPVFMVSALGASALSVGFVEGAAEATALVSRVFSGAISDWLGRRKLLTVLGYGLAAATKPLFPLAASVDWVFAARFLDRVGKGIRGAPRDALVGEIAPPALRGAAYGLRQSLDTVGAFAGPLLAVALMAAFADDLRLVLWVAVAPAALAVAILVVGVREPAPARAATHGPATHGPAGPRSRAIEGVGAAYWGLLAVASALMLGRFSEAFLVLRAHGAGLAVGMVPLVLVVMNLAYAASAYPAGALSDRLGRRGVLVAGMLVLMAADAVLASAGGVAAVLAGVVLWGLHMGLTQGLLAAMVADAAPARLGGTAFGVFGLASGVAVLAASLAAGWLWDAFGPPAPFWAGVAVTGLALALLAAVPRG
ncbi:MAG: MFS transporter, partial [Proteobacteria bacterium]|nr:MFS transporter [Pseudomonadota bacterium]